MAALAGEQAEPWGSAESGLKGLSLFLQRVYFFG